MVKNKWFPRFFKKILFLGVLCIQAHMHFLEARGLPPSIKEVDALNHEIYHQITLLKERVIFIATSSSIMEFVQTDLSNKFEYAIVPVEPDVFYQFFTKKYVRKFFSENNRSKTEDPLVLAFTRSSLKCAHGIYIALFSEEKIKELLEEYDYSWKKTMDWLIANTLIE